MRRRRSYSYRLHPYIDTINEGLPDEKVIIINGFGAGQQLPDEFSGTSFSVSAEFTAPPLEGKQKGASMFELNRGSGNHRWSKQFLIQ